MRVLVGYSDVTWPVQINAKTTIRCCLAVCYWLGQLSFSPSNSIIWATLPVRTPPHFKPCNVIRIWLVNGKWIMLLNRIFIPHKFYIWKSLENLSDMVEWVCFWQMFEKFTSSKKLSMHPKLRNIILISKIINLQLTYPTFLIFLSSQIRWIFLFVYLYFIRTIFNIRRF